LQQPNNILTILRLDTIFTNYFYVSLFTQEPDDQFEPITFTTITFDDAADDDHEDDTLLKTAEQSAIPHGEEGCGIYELKT
jgi:hypothetical protein